jgi:hypothetical protein
MRAPRSVDALLLILALAVVTYVVVRVVSRPPAASSGGDVTVARAETWMTAELPAAARVGVDSAVFSDIAGAGRPTVSVLASGWTDWHSDTHILSTPELRNEAARDPVVSSALQSSLPVAVFGVGAERVEVRQVAVDGAAAMMRRWQKDVTNRAVGGAGLLRNPQVLEDSASRAVLLRGGLDLRAVVLVGLLAAKSDVRIMDIASNPNEAAARMPARRVRIAIAHAASALAAVLAMLPSAYRPSSVTVLPGGQRELAWPVAVAPVDSLG